METRRIFAPAKLNLALHITGRRDDGYHLLSSLVTFVEDVGDTLSITPNDTLTLEITGPCSAPLQDHLENNLVLKVARLMQRTYGVNMGASIRLEKHLPVASGIGGGSADAAAVATLLNQYWALGLPEAELAELLLPLGADIPMCLYGKPALIHGIGEKITPLAAFPSLWLVLVNPGSALCTADVFAGYAASGEAYSPSLAWPDTITEHQTLEWLSALGNDLYPPAARLLPSFHEAIKVLEDNDDCLLARMSGSGATCFGIYPDYRRAESAARQLRQHDAKWWVTCGKSVRA